MNEETKLPLDNELLKIMRNREMREAVEFEEKQAAAREAKEQYKIRLERRVAADKYVYDQIIKRQSRCDHRKGTSGSGPKAKHVDYMVSFHTFPGNLQQVKCLKCGAKVHPGDTSETLVVNGKRIKNHIWNPFTRSQGLSWADAFKMTLEENTTNKPSKSEIVVEQPNTTPVNA